MLSHLSSALSSVSFSLPPRRRSQQIKRSRPAGSAHSSAMSMSAMSDYRATRDMNFSLETEYSSSDDDDGPHAAEDGTSLVLSTRTGSFNTQTESDDRVPELSSLMGSNGARKTYGSSRSMHQRSSSDESIATVAALPGMILRAHSVMYGKHGTCNIRHTSPKVGE